MRTQLKSNLDIQNKVDQLLDCKNILIVGSKNSGKTSIALNYAIHEFTKSKSFFFTTQKKEEVITKAVKLFPELETVIKSNLIIYQAPIVSHMQVDKVLSDILLGILQVTSTTKPDKIVFDEITSFLAFSDLDLLRKVFRQLLSALEQKNITALFTVAEPVSQRSIEIVGILTNEFANYLNLKTNPIF